MNNQEKIYSILPALLIIIAIFCSVRARADMYKYVDDKGTLSITDDLAKVPEKYRANIETIKEEKIQVVTPPSQNVPEKEVLQSSNKQQPTDSAQRITESPLKFLEGSNKALIIAIAASIGLLIATIFVLKKYLNNKMLNRLIFLLITGLVVTFLYKMYAENVYKRFSDAKKTAEDAKKLVEQQQEKQMKGLDDIGK